MRTISDIRRRDGETDAEYLVRAGWTLDGPYYGFCKEYPFYRNLTQAMQRQALSDQPILLAEIARMEPEREWIPLYEEIQSERERAHKKHGDTSMESQPATALLRLTILMEEIGEVAKEYNEARHRGEDEPNVTRLRKELIQVAAMSSAWASVLPSPPDRAQERGSE